MVSSRDLVQGPAYDPRIVREAEVLEGTGLVVEQVDQLNPRSLELSERQEHMPCSSVELQLDPAISNGMSRRQGDRGFCRVGRHRLVPPG